jgi:hypothetical protein
MRPIYATSILFALALGGCAGTIMDKAECTVADWKAIGYEHGAKGYGTNAFGKYRKACAKHGIAADFDVYRSGHAEGIAIYCRPPNGYRLGTRGYRYSACPANLASAFQSANDDGYGLYERRVARDRLASQLSSNKRRSKEIEQLIARKTARLVSGRISPTKVASLAVQLKQLGEEKVEVEQSIRQLELDYADASRVYEGYRNSVANRY